MKKKLLIILGILFVLFIIGSIAVTPNSKTQTSSTTGISAARTAKKEAKPTGFTDGVYLVNKDIPSGLYRASITDNWMNIGYVERSKDVGMEAGSIIANIILTGNGYVEIKDSDVAVKLQSIKLEPVKLAELKPNIQTEVTDGIYLIGYDLAPGTYKVAVTDTVSKMGYVERSKSVAMGMNDIIANEVLQGPGYVKINKGDFAVRLQGVKLTLTK